MLLNTVSDLDGDGSLACCHAEVPMCNGGGVVRRRWTMDVGGQVDEGKIFWAWPAPLPLTDRNLSGEPVSKTPQSIVDDR
jgi:hypothetical protein